MKLGDNILKLRKDCKLSQEQLAEKVDVTRQTISNWELGETSPNPEQLKLLSKALNVSIDELLNNDIKQVLVEKVNNTEKLAEIIIKILKVLGIIFVVGFAITIFINIMFGAKKDSMTIKENQTVLLNCQLNSEKYTYLIEYDKDDNIVDASGSDYIINVVKDKQFNKAKVLVKYIESYFEESEGKMRKRTHKKNFWFNDEEENRIKELCNKSGMNESDIVRNLIMGNDIKEAPSNKFYEVVRDLRSISNNINQLTRKAHSLGFIDEREYREEVVRLDIIIDDLKLQFLNKNIAGNK